MKKMISTLGGTLLSLLRVIMYSKFFYQLPKSAQRLDTCFVFGNGPSLDGDLAQCEDIRAIGDVWCVNQFAISDLYEKVQPACYVLADPSYWGEELSVRLTTYREQLLFALKSKTTWPLTVYLPYFAKGRFEKRLSETPNVTLVFYNNVPVMGYKRLTNILYDRGLGMPRAQNVLIAALYLSLHRGYKKIFIFGADHSWHETIELDDANRVCQRDRHFYEKEAKLVPFTMGGNEDSTFTMAALFSALSKMFEGYWKISEYSEHVGAEIFNASSITYIDAFKRIKPADVVDFRLNSSNAS